MSLNSEEHRWEIARNKLAVLGSVPASFSALIRKIRSDMLTNPPKLSSVSLYELNRLLKGPSMLSPLAHAAIEFHPETPLDAKNIAKSVTEVFSLEELCSLIGVLYLTRQVKKRCSEEEWKFISERLITFSTMAGHLGNMIKPIGFERALCTVTYSILGMALFQSSNPKEFTTYRRHLKKSQDYYDTEMELKLFGCTSREVCSLLSQSVALSSSLAADFLMGLEAEEGKRPASGVHALNIWLSSLIRSCSAPQVAMDAKWYPTRDKVTEIQEMAKKTIANQSETIAWILKEGFQLQVIKSLLRAVHEDSTEEGSWSDDISAQEDPEDPFSEDTE